MKKKIMYGIVLFIGSYVIANIIAYNKMSHSNITMIQPRFPTFRDGSIDKRSIAAVYKNSNNDSACLCRYSMVDRYRYIFYQPEELASGYTIIFDKSYLNLYNRQDKIIKAESDSNQILIGAPARDLLHFESISKKIVVLDTLNHHADLFYLDTVSSEIKNEINWFEKFTWGPVMYFFK